VAKLHSLVDLLKKNLYFTEGLTIIELTRYIQRKMLQDYTFGQAQSFVNSCLHQCACFYSSDGYIWYMDKKGLRENDHFFNTISSHQKPLKFSAASPIKKSRKKNTKIVSHPTNLNSDGRIVQLEDGNWGLTEWNIDTNDYRLRHVIIKTLHNNTNGLTYAGVQDEVEIYKKVSAHAIRDILHKYPYFRKQNDKWSYSIEARYAYEKTLEKYIKTIHKEQLKHLSQKHKLSKIIKLRELQFREIYTAKKQIAASLAEKNQNTDEYDHLIQRFAEKDLLLSLRKRELYKIKEEKFKIERKNVAILQQCKLWVNKSKIKENENENLIEKIGKLKDEIAELAMNEREFRYKFSQQKDKNAIEKAEIIRENVNIKHQLEKMITKSKKEEKELKVEIGKLTAELRRSVKENEERRYSMEMLEGEFRDIRKENRLLKASSKHPLVRFSLKIATFFGR